MKKTLLLVLSIITILVIVACGDGGKKGNGEKNTTSGKENNTGSNQQDETNDDDIVDEKVEFESFLVERCVRKALGKEWSEDITTRELAKMKELVIQEVYNPAFVGEVTFIESVDDNETGGRKSIYENTIYNMTYIDLVDLKYFINLETLKIDNISTDSMLTNIDAITNCKKLKELSLLYNFSGETSKNFGGVGYLYWAGIIAELPQLKTVDFSTYIDEHTKNVLLSKTTNKDIKFVQYDADKIGRLYWRPVKSINELKKVADLAQYKTAWNYDYRGLEKTNKLVYQYGSEGVFPYLEVNSEDELKNVLSSLDKDVEDIIIKISEDVENIDFSLFNRFENLVTLTIFNTEVSYKTKMIWNETECFYEYERMDYKLPTIINSNTLASNKNLRTISLAGLDGDFTGVSEVTGLKELYISSCVVNNGDFQKLDQVNKLLTSNILYNKSNKDESYSISDDLARMENVKFFMASKTGDISNLVEKFPKLETLIIRNLDVLMDLGTIDTPSLKNLYINYAGVIQLNDETLTGLKNLDSLSVLKIDGLSSYYLTEINTSILLEMDKLYSVVVPYCNILDKNFDASRNKRIYASAELANSVVKKDNLSQFIIERSVFGSNYLDSSYILETFDKKIYDAGIYSGFIDKYMLACEIGEGATTILGAIEKNVDAVLTSDVQMLYESIPIDYITHLISKKWNDEIEARKYILVGNSGAISPLFGWKETTKYLGYEYEITEKLDKKQIISEKAYIDLEDDGINYESVDEIVQVELHIYGYENKEKISCHDTRVFIKIGGKYYLWWW